MDSGPQASMQSGPATRGTSHRAGRVDVVAAGWQRRVDPNRSDRGRAAPGRRAGVAASRGAAWARIHGRARAAFFGRKMGRNSKIAQPIGRVRAKCCRGEKGTLVHTGVIFEWQP